MGAGKWSIEALFSRIVCRQRGAFLNRNSLHNTEINAESDELRVKAIISTVTRPNKQQIEELCMKFGNLLGQYSALNKEEVIPS